jgi:uncharacterized membrane protein YqiK
VRQGKRRGDLDGRLPAPPDRPFRENAGMRLAAERRNTVASPVHFLLWSAAVLVLLVGGVRLLGVRYIPHSKVGIVEKMWSRRGSLRQGQIVAVGGEAGYQADLLRGGLHWGFFPWQYRIQRVPLVSIPEGKIGYVYSRDGLPLSPVQTLGSVVESNNFQDARAFLRAGGQRGRQRAILREGVYAVNLALFVVVAEDRVYYGPGQDRTHTMFADWQSQLHAIGGFNPVVVGHGGLRREDEQADSAAGDDNIGVVTVHDGPPIESGEVIAPEVHSPAGVPDHDCFQDPEVLLQAGGCRGKQLQVLTDGTYFINRWFATVEFKPKTVIPIGYVGVVVSYFGSLGEDLTGEQFRYGEQVEHGRRGVWRKPLPPGKYPLNPYALKVELVPTVNFVLRWITGMVEEHQYDRDLTSIALITADGYEPLLPLSLVLHIDYEMAPRVVQRFGDVRRLISQTLDPIISAYFRDVAQSTQMLDLLTHREEIQRLATEELGRRFRDYDITCVAVLIGRPESQAAEAERDPIQALFDQLRQRRLANEQIETYARQQEAARQQRELNEARAAADKQAQLTGTKIDIEIAANRGEAELAEARRLAERDVTRAEGESRSRDLIGRGEAARISQTGSAEASVFQRKIEAYGDPRLFALNLVADQMAHSQQALVPERVLMMGGDGNGNALGAVSLFARLLAMLVADKAGVGMDGSAETVRLQRAVEGLVGAAPATAGEPPVEET